MSFTDPTRPESLIALEQIHHSSQSEALGSTFAAELARLNEKIHCQSAWVASFLITGCAMGVFSSRQVVCGSLGFPTEKYKRWRLALRRF
jgi:hypothetical protein